MMDVPTVNAPMIELLESWMKLDEAVDDPTFSRELHELRENDLRLIRSD